MQKQKKTNIKLTNEEHNTLIHKHKTGGGGGGVSHTYLPIANSFYF